MKHLKNNLLLNKFAQKINNPSDIKIILPESNDRIFRASEILNDIGITILIREDVEDAKIESLSILKKLKFAKNWPQEDLLEYSNHPYIKSLLLLKENEVGGVVCGSELSSADVIRGALRIIGLKNSVKNLSSMFLMISQEMGRIFLLFQTAQLFQSLHQSSWLKLPINQA